VERNNGNIFAARCTVFFLPKRYTARSGSRVARHFLLRDEPPPPPPPPLLFFVVLLSGPRTNGARRFSVHFETSSSLFRPRKLRTFSVSVCSKSYRRIRLERRTTNLRSFSPGRSKTYVAINGFGHLKRLHEYPIASVHTL